MTLFFDAPDLESCGQSLGRFVNAAEKAGFDMFVGEVSADVAANDPRSNGDPTWYGPPLE